MTGLGVALFAAVGVPEEEAELMAGHLVEASLLGHDTHGVLRYPQYVQMVRSGLVRPGVRIQIRRQTPCMAQISGGWNFGPVTATQAVCLAMEKATASAVGVVSVQECHHVARLGRFAALAARQNLIAMIMANGHGDDLAVAPMGGRSRCLSTNPVCVAIPAPRPWPVVLDMTTSAVSGGALRLCRNRRERAPKGTLIDASGELSEEVEAYYGPPQGAILPLGFPQTGHKGFGLALVIDILAGALSGAGCSRPGSTSPGNALFIAVLNIAAFVPLSEFLAETGRFIDWVKSSPPAAGVAQVELPGEHSYHLYQQRQREGLSLDPATWGQIQALAAELKVALPVPIEK